jgi:hypothetical protein
MYHNKSKNSNEKTKIFQNGMQNNTDRIIFILSLNHSLITSVPVVSRLVWTLNRHTDVICLIFGKLGELSSKLAEMKCGNLLIEVLRQNIDLLFIFARSLLFPQLNLSNDLVGEGA